jgi:tRNA(fMet)-specific endonuclease VapC
MGLILDTSVLIAGEHRGSSVSQIVNAMQQLHGPQPVELSVITIAELTHGIYRAKSADQADRRSRFVAEVIKTISTHNLTPSIAALIGRIEGEQAAIGNIIAFQDLTISATAISLDFSVITANLKHFKLIPSLKVLSF